MPHCCVGPGLHAIRGTEEKEPPVVVRMRLLALFFVATASACSWRPRWPKRWRWPKQVTELLGGMEMVQVGDVYEDRQQAGPAAEGGPGSPVESSIV